MRKLLCVICFTLLLSSGVSAADVNGVEVHVLSKTSSSWDGRPLPDRANGKPEITILRIKIPPGAPAAGKALSALPLPTKTTLAVILRQNSRPIAPRADTVILAGDHIVAVTPDTLEAELRKTLLGETRG